MKLICLLFFSFFSWNLSPGKSFFIRGPPAEQNIIQTKNWLECSFLFLGNRLPEVGGRSSLLTLELLKNKVLSVNRESRVPSAGLEQNQGKTRVLVWNLLLRFRVAGGQNPIIQPLVFDVLDGIIDRHDLMFFHELHLNVIIIFASRHKLIIERMKEKVLCLNPWVA